jgi:hypothetical protein
MRDGSCQPASAEDEAVYPVAVAVSVTGTLRGFFSPGERVGANQYSMTWCFGTIEAR